MNSERVQTTLRFVGDWPWWAGIGAALILGALAWWLYHRETDRFAWWLRALLPTLRAIAVVMMMLMLAGPVLHHRKVIGKLSRLFLFVDGSASMGLADPSMDAGRKIAILQRLGLLKPEAIQTELAAASEALADARAIAEKAKNSQGVTTEAWNKLPGEFSTKIDAAREQLAKSGMAKDRVDTFASELMEPARKLAGREIKQIDDRIQATADLTRLGAVAARWGGELQEAFERKVNEMAGGDESPVKAALAKFNTMPRWQRLQSMLLEGEKSQLLTKLGENYDVQLLSLDGSEAHKIWQPTRKDSSPPTALPKPAAGFTNLSTGLRSGIGEQEKDQRGAVVIFSDGQHNEGESPAEIAKVFGARGMPVFTVGFGSQVHPRDIAFLKAEGPDAVFFEDRVHGAITLKDDMPAGLPFKVSIRDGDKVLWEQQFTTEGQNARQVQFDFPIGDYVKEKMKGQRADVQQASIPLDFKVTISGVEGDSQRDNNEGSLRVRAVTQKRSVLVLDGRSRWETRYLRNLFERDEQWEVNCVVAGTQKGQTGFARGDKPEQFPTEQAQLQNYDLIIFGEVPRTVFHGAELDWIKDFVEKRGGALVFIDGSRGKFKEYADSPIGPLFPVEWKAAPVREGITKVSLTQRSSTLAPFSLAPDKAQNAEVWGSLLPPRWISAATPLPGAETLMEVDVNGQKMPALVLRSFGAGKVMYQAFDESWRWRYEVADQHHVRYWNQLANWIAELPFAVRDKFVSLDAGAITYQPGESADLRVRLRDGEGKPVTNAAVDAVLYKDGKKVASIRMLADDNAGGLFRGKTAALEPGDYKVGIESAAIPANELKARTSFKVEPRETGELTQLSVNEDLLRQMAFTSGGQYLREEKISSLAEMLAPMSQGKVIESDTVLWQSYWWFVPLIGLLTVEWIIRKRVGML